MILERYLRTLDRICSSVGGYMEALCGSFSNMLTTQGNWSITRLLCKPANARLVKLVGKARARA